MLNHNNPYKNTEPWHFVMNEEFKMELAFRSRRYEICTYCKDKIYYSNESYEQDPCYKIGDDIVCENCTRDYVEENLFLELKEY